VSDGLPSLVLMLRPTSPSLLPYPALFRSQHNGADVFVGIECAQRVGQLIDERIVQGVQRFGPIQRQQAHPATNLYFYQRRIHAFSLSQSNIGIMKKETLLYSVTPFDPAGHRLKVRLPVARPDPNGQAFSLPAWIPGSYLVRDFARQIETLQASSRGK